MLTSRFFSPVKDVAALSHIASAFLKTVVTAVESDEDRKVLMR
jgi:hypothetical protein